MDNFRKRKDSTARSTLKKQKIRNEASNNEDSSSENSCQQSMTPIQCIICLDTSNCKNFAILKCSHSFHVPCLAKWLRTADWCPICRRPVSNNRQEKRSGNSNVRHNRTNDEPFPGFRDANAVGPATSNPRFTGRRGYSNLFRTASHEQELPATSIFSFNSAIPSSGIFELASEEQRGHAILNFSSSPFTSVSDNQVARPATSVSRFTGTYGNCMLPIIASQGQMRQLEEEENFDVEDNLRLP